MLVLTVQLLKLAVGGSEMLLMAQSCTASGDGTLEAHGSCGGRVTGAEWLLDLERPRCCHSASRGAGPSVGGWQLWVAVLLWSLWFLRMQWCLWRLYSGSFDLAENKVEFSG